MTKSITGGKYIYIQIHDLLSRNSSCPVRLSGGDDALPLYLLTASWARW
jgi:hypothetical protein